MDIMELFMILVVMFENYILVSFVELFYPRVRKIDKWIALLVMLAISHFYSSTENPFGTLLTLFVVMIYSYISLEKATLLSKTAVSIFSLSLPLVTNLMVIFLMNLIGISSKQIFDVSLDHYIWIVLLSKVLLLVAFLIFKARSTKLNFKFSQWLLFGITSISTTLCVFIIFLIFLKNPSSDMECAFVFLLLIITYMTFFTYFLTSAKSNEELMEKKLEINMLEANREFSKQIQESYDANRKLQHDLKYHFTAIYGKAEQENNTEIMEYVQTIVNGIESVKIINTDNPTFNNLINCQILNMKEMNIDFKHQISDSLSFMKDNDLAVVIGNLVSNAIEAQTQVEEDRFIFMKVVRVSNMINIQVMNSCNEEMIQHENGRFISTKKSKEAHGYGLKNVENTIEKYGGYMSAETDSGKFNVLITMMFTI